MKRLLGIFIGGFAVSNGLAILFAEDCPSVSFDGQGSRVAVAQCFADGSGAIPGWVAGLGMIAVGFIVVLVGFKKQAK